MATTHILILGYIHINSDNAGNKNIIIRKLKNYVKKSIKIKKMANSAVQRPQLVLRSLRAGFELFIII